MDLPKIRNEDLPKELKEILGDEDAEFEAIMDPMDYIDIQFDPDAWYEGRTKVAEMLVESRKKLEEIRNEIKRNNKGSEKKIIKARKKNKMCYTKEEVMYAKLLKKRAEQKLKEKHLDTPATDS